MLLFMVTMAVIATAVVNAATPQERAKDMVAQMTLAEKMSMM